MLALPFVTVRKPEVALNRATRVMLAAATTIGVLSGFASSPTSHRKYYMKGDTLVEYMRAYEGVGPDPSTYQVGAFMGYVIGAYDAAPDLCSGDQVTVGQLCSVVAKYLKDHPEAWDRPARDLVNTALQQAFACK